MTEFERDAHAVLLPVVSDFEVDPWLRRLLEQGTRSVLVGESRDEYVARAMSADRHDGESVETFTAFAADVERSTDGLPLLAVDQEPWGIARLHGLVPVFPDKDELANLSDEEISAAAAAVGAAARRLGVNVFLSPVLDVLSGANPWLQGRTLDYGHEQVGRIAAAFVTGVQGAGVMAVAKHFPGHPELADDPALRDTVLDNQHTVDADLLPFGKVIAAGVRAIMTGPVVVNAIDPDEPASTSAKTVGILRRDLGFQGLIVTDDLDTPSTTRGRSLRDTVLASLEAGADLLLLPGGPELIEIAHDIARQAQLDPAFGIRLAEAAERVRHTADLAGSGRN
ncbi:glycoside hydrolase family 3 N-terminal domain-containing protein [Nocardia sp. NBC_01009]|uniref:glycoside hydrolase family 3 N-terminal domain-containing protein n=1 Tax=Nocardia sp. NBC_01009 TaxID=2975996 RepID=UPI00386B9F7A|nr:hypothetical protein OHA42_26090 [Nocardia sp. NBC_01009]